jgi:hypothetical protein
MAINFKERLSNATNKLINNLLGTPVQTTDIEPSTSYGEKIDNYLNTLGEQEYMKPLLNQRKELSLGLDGYKEAVANGLNFGIPEIAKAQEELGIRVPKTDEEIAKAQEGTFNEPSKLTLGTSNRQGGFINDLVSGYRENLTEGFDTENLAPNENKGLATRIGEGLGTLTRVQSNPLARGLLAGAAALALGGGAGDALAYGLSTGVGRQTNLTKDKAYRQNLQQMGYNQEEIDSIPGLVTDEIYGNLIRAQQLKDNAEYRNMLLQNEQAAKAEALKYQQMKDVYERAKENKEFNYRAQQDAIKNDLERQALETKKANSNTKEEQKRRQSQATLNMIGAAMNAVDANPNAYGFFKGVAPNDVTNRADAKGVKARAVVNSVAAEYRKYLTGAQMSDRERKDYEKFLPNPRDNADIIKRKLEGMQMVISAREGLYADEPAMNIDINAIDAELKRRGQ